MAEALTGGELPRILVVDDSPTQVQMLEAWLADRGLRVSTARDGQMALDILERQSFDLIVCDVLMPRMSGYELCRTLRARPETRKIPILLLTGLTDSTDYMDSVRAGADAYLPKTSPIEQVIHTIEELLELRPRPAR